MENYSSVEKEIVKNNRKIFYREGLYVINSILEKKDTCGNWDHT